MILFVWNCSATLADYMDVNATLPPDFEFVFLIVINNWSFFQRWYENQIAGHHPSVVRNGLRQIGKKYKNLTFNIQMNQSDKNLQN